MGAKDFSFMKSLFNGNIDTTYLKDFPFFTTPREEEFQLMSRTIEEWLTENCNSEKFDDEKKFTDEFMQGIKDLGLFGLIVPEEFGGLALTHTLYFRTLEILSKHDSSLGVTVGAHQSIGLKALSIFGTKTQKEKYLPKLATGEMIAAFALTEPSAGSDAAGIKARCVRQGDHYILNGSKLWITNGSFADFFTVFAKETIDGKEKITALIVTRDLGGVTHGPEEQKMGLKASSTVEVFFKDVKVPLENILGQPGEGFKVAMSVLNEGRIGLATAFVGGLKMCIKQCSAYAKERKAFGKTIADFTLIQDIVSRLTCSCYALESMAYFTASLIDQGTFDYSIEAAICKVFGSESGFNGINMAIQLHGGNGYMKDYGLERRLRDARVTSIYEGTNEILRLFIALNGIKEPANELKELIKHLKGLKSFQLGAIGPVASFALRNIKKKTKSPQLNGLHSELSKEVEHLGRAANTLSNYTQMLIRRYGQKIIDEEIQLARLANMAIEVFKIAAVLARINAMLEKHGGVEKNAEELRVAKMVITTAAYNVRYIAHDMRVSNDKDTQAIAKNIFENERYTFDLERIK